MSAFLDGPDFNRRLFFPRSSVSPPPPGASDHFVAVPEGRLHVRQHQVPEARCAVLLFHGNGEVVSDYDDVAERFAAIGAAPLATEAHQQELTAVDALHHRKAVPKDSALQVPTHLVLHPLR